MPSVKTIKGVPIFLALLLAAGAARAERMTGRYEKTLPLTPGARFELYNFNGGVVLEAWDRNEVRIEAEKWAESRSAGVAKRAVERIRFEVSQAPDVLVVQALFPDPGIMEWLQGKLPKVGARFRVRVPRQATVAVETSKGDIQLMGTRGDAFLESSNGSILVNGVQGKMSLVAVNGDVKLRLPAASRMTLDAMTTEGTGGIRSDFQVAGADPQRKHSLKGVVNGGGSKVFIRAVKGSIQLSKM